MKLPETPELEAKLAAVIQEEMCAVAGEPYDKNGPADAMAEASAFVAIRWFLQRGLTGINDSPMRDVVAALHCAPQHVREPAMATLFSFVLAIDEIRREKCTNCGQVRCNSAALAQPTPETEGR